MNWPSVVKAGTEKRILVWNVSFSSTQLLMSPKIYFCKHICTLEEQSWLKFSTEKTIFRKFGKIWPLYFPLSTPTLTFTQTSAWEKSDRVTKLAVLPPVWPDWAICYRLGYFWESCIPFVQAQKCYFYSQRLAGSCVRLCTTKLSDCIAFERKKHVGHFIKK